MNSSNGIQFFTLTQPFQLLCLEKKTYRYESKGPVGEVLGLYSTDSSSYVMQCKLKVMEIVPRDELNGSKALVHAFPYLCSLVYATVHFGTELLVVT